MLYHYLEKKTDRRWPSWRRRGAGRGHHLRHSQSCEVSRTTWNQNSMTSIKHVITSCITHCAPRCVPLCTDVVPILVTPRCARRAVRRVAFVPVGEAQKILKETKEREGGPVSAHWTVSSCNSSPRSCFDWQGRVFPQVKERHFGLHCGPEVEQRVYAVCQRVTVVRSV